VDLENKSEEFLSFSPTGKEAVVADGDSLYESNVVNQYLDEVFESPKLLPEGPKERASARSGWLRPTTTSSRPSSLRALAASGGLGGSGLGGAGDVVEDAHRARGAFGRALIPGGWVLSG